MKDKYYLLTPPAAIKPGSHAPTTTVSWAICLSHVTTCTAWALPFLRKEVLVTPVLWSVFQLVVMKVTHAVPERQTASLSYVAELKP